MFPTPGFIRVVSVSFLSKELMAKHPTRVIEKAVRGMLPKSRLGKALFGNLHVYAGDQHPHAAQNPTTI